MLRPNQVSTTSRPWVFEVFLLPPSFNPMYDGINKDMSHHGIPWNNWHWRNAATKPTATTCSTMLPLPFNPHNEEDRRFNTLQPDMQVVKNLQNRKWYKKERLPLSSKPCIEEERRLNTLDPNTEPKHTTKSIGPLKTKWTEENDLLFKQFHQHVIIQ